MKFVAIKTKNTIALIFS